MENDGDCKLMSSPGSRASFTAWSFCVVAELEADSAFRRNFFSEPRGRLLHGPAAEKKSDKKLLLAACTKDGRHLLRNDHKVAIDR